MEFVYARHIELSSPRQHLRVGRTYPARREELHIAGPQAVCGLISACAAASRSRRSWAVVPALFPLKAGNRLRCLPGAIHPRSLELAADWAQSPLIARTLEGTQADWFRTSEFFDQEFTVTPSGNRMGVKAARQAVGHAGARAGFRTRLPRRRPGNARRTMHRTRRGWNKPSVDIQRLLRSSALTWISWPNFDPAESSDSCLFFIGAGGTALSRRKRSCTNGSPGCGTTEALVL